MHDTCRDKPLEKQCGDCLYETAKELRAWKQQVEDAIKAAMDETCDANERHCTCVPLLRSEVRRLREQPNKLSDLLGDALQHCPESYSEPILRILKSNEAAEAGGDDHVL